MYGCNNFCSYCIVPYTRGGERSRTKEAILEEIKGLSAAGYKEVTLLGQNVNAYGKDLYDNYGLGELLEDVAKLNIPRITFMTSHPWDFTDKMIDVIASHENILPYIHLPLQSGSNKILKLMGRRYTKESYLELFDKMKKKIPNVSISTDIIVGFPGETYEDFKETLSLIREVEFTSLFTFIFSPRVGTPAAKMDDPISAEEKSKWFRELLDVQEEIAAKRCSSMVGKTEKVLIEGENDKNGELCGRTSGNIIVELEGSKDCIGTFRNVKITKARNWILKGELVK